ncbi:unnamed protein product [Pedinophyceae sp. YPF-701]|nr:unnamed protein product [Pedinophyceae sp. YPF-701]
MKVLDAQEALLTNCEVYDILVQRGCDRARAQGVPVSTQVEQDVFAYLTGVGATVRVSQEQMNEFREQMKPFELSKTEIMQFLNHRPKIAVEAYTILDRAEERFSNEQLEEMCAITATVLAGESTAAEDPGKSPKRGARA